MHEFLFPLERVGLDALETENHAHTNGARSFTYINIVYIIHLRKLIFGDFNKMGLFFRFFRSVIKSGNKYNGYKLNTAPFHTCRNHRI